LRDNAAEERQETIEAVALVHRADAAQRLGHRQEHVAAGPSIGEPPSRMSISAARLFEHACPWVAELARLAEESVRFELLPGCGWMIVAS
jgi:hypothetical protein